MTTGITFLEQLRQDVERAFDRAEQSPRAAARPRRRFAASLAVAAGACLLAVAGFAVASHLAGVSANRAATTAHSPSSGGPPPTTRPTIGLPQPGLGENPFMFGGRQTTLAAAERWAGFPTRLPMPSAGGATMATLSRVWIAGADSHPARMWNDREVVLDFDQASIRIFIEEFDPRYAGRVRAHLQQFQDQFPPARRLRVVRLSGGWGVLNGPNTAVVWWHGLSVVIERLAPIVPVPVPSSVPAIARSLRPA